MRIHHPESRMQIALFKWLRMRGILAFAIPNGFPSTPQAGARWKAEGLTAGVPDLFIPGLRLFIELKAPCGRLTSCQVNMHAKLRELGYAVEVYFSLDEAIQGIADAVALAESNGLKIKERL